MAIIVIKDLPESVDLDRQAMVAITGGARARDRQTLLGRTIFRSARTINDPTSFAYSPLADANGRSAANTPPK
jgi:hypothetical protein